MKLVLFDIDGTLLHADGQGRAAVEEGLSRFLNLPVSASGVSFCGRTDLEIVRDVIALHTPEQLDNGVDLQAAIRVYVSVGLENWIDDRVRALPGAIQLVKTLSQRDDLVLGLVTGNAKLMARRKLTSIGLDQYFEFGAFGDEHESRIELIRLAIDRASRIHNHGIKHSSVRIVGDTTHDILACRDARIPCIAVSTGPHSMRRLAHEKPAFLFSSLEDTEAVQSAIFSPTDGTGS